MSVPRFLYRDGFWKIVAVVLFIAAIWGLREILKPLVYSLPASTAGLIAVGMFLLGIGLVIGSRSREARRHRDVPRGEDEG